MTNLFRTMEPYKFKLDMTNGETIRVCSGGIVDSIQIGDRDRAGGETGKEHEFTLEEGEMIVLVKGTRVRFPHKDSELCIGKIKFKTNLGNVHGPFGHSAKGKKRRIEEKFNFNCAGGLKKISGLAGDYVNSVNCKFQME